MNPILDDKAPSDLLFDCDVHPEISGTDALLPYLDSYWAESITSSELPDFQTFNYPPKAPISARKDWHATMGKPAGTLDQLRSELLDPFGIDRAIMNPLFGSFMLMNADMGHALSVAYNKCIADEWLAKDERLLASIAIAPQDPQNAVAEIRRLAGDPRFVQVMLFASNDLLLGKRNYWPIYEAAEQAGLPILIHAGSAFRYSVTPGGSTTYFFEDYNGQSVSMFAQVVSIIAEGVLQKFPNLKFVLAESGVTWLPAAISRINKYWLGMRREVPWLSTRPGDLLLDRFYFTLQPFDCPDDPEVAQMALRHLGRAKLLFSTDYPHWQFEGSSAIPPGFKQGQVRQLGVENPAVLYGKVIQ